MPNKTFPMEMKLAAAAPGIRKALFLDHEITSGDDCPNCSGMGFLYLFLATDGPYDSPGAPYSKISKFHDGHWWIGQIAGFRCPVCGGLGRPLREFKARRVEASHVTAS